MCFLSYPRPDVTFPRRCKQITKNQKLNPIMQDTKHGNLRFVHNVFPHHGYIWNYGALPQTYEDPNHIDTFTKQKGDHDPIDVCEIGQKIHKQGAVVQVKVLGVFALIDEGWLPFFFPHFSLFPFQKIIKLIFLLILVCVRIYLIYIYFLFNNCIIIYNSCIVQFFFG